MASCFNWKLTINWCFSFDQRVRKMVENYCEKCPFDIYAPPALFSFRRPGPRADLNHRLQRFSIAALLRRKAIFTSRWLHCRVLAHTQLCFIYLLLTNIVSHITKCSAAEVSSFNFIVLDHTRSRVKEAAHGDVTTIGLSVSMLLSVCVSVRLSVQAQLAAVFVIETWNFVPTSIYMSLTIVHISVKKKKK